MAIDFNNCEPQRDGYELIPAGTIAPVSMIIRAGGSGEGGWITQSRNSDAQYLNCEFTVTEGPYARRKIFQNIVISGGRLDERGQSIGGQIGMSLLRGILESARNIMPSDQSDKARVGRNIAGWQDFSNLEFTAKIGVEKDKTGNYSDKNKITAAITPDMKEYGKPVQTTAQAANSSWQQSGQYQQTSSPRPAWA